MITIKSFEFNYFQENTFLLYDDTREAVLIDCGYSSARGSRIWKRFYI